MITDIQMPNVDGCEFVRQLRADPALAATPVIFCTARSREEAQVLADAWDVADVLTKPWEPEAVQRAVASALSIAPLPAPPTPEPEMPDQPRTARQTEAALRQ